jgi:hypothetical protein
MASTFDPTQREPSRLEMLVTMMMRLTGLKMTTTGLNSNDNKTESNYSFNKKSNRDSDNNCAADVKTSKCHQTKLILEINRTRRYPGESSFDWTSLAHT